MVTYQMIIVLISILRIKKRKINKINEARPVSPVTKRTELGCSGPGIELLVCPAFKVHVLSPYHKVSVAFPEASERTHMFPVEMAKQR